jgi:4-hydroxy-2-oxoheptanedioate aldolase
VAFVNPILERWRNGGVVYSAWVSSGEPLTANWLAAAGFDEVLADLQHGAVEVGHLPALFAAIEARGVAPAARVPANETTIIGRVLDMGALSVMVPMVESREEAEAAVAACRFAPTGRRSMGPLRPMTTFGTEDPAELSKVACVVQIETARGLANADAIASTPGLDAVFVGPGDLSLSLGLYEPGVGEDERTEAREAATAEILAACQRAGIVAGIITPHGAAARLRIEQGFRLVGLTSDLSLLIEGGARELAAAKGEDG